MSDPITTLAADVEDRWRAENHRPSHFPEICCRALSTAQLHRRFGLQQLLDALPELERWPPHPAASALALFRSSRIAIFAHLWSDGIGTPHHHAWSGAFQILHGSVIHTTFDFEEHGRTSPRLRYGDLTTRDIDLLDAGDAVPVTPGADYIHGLWHADRPSLSLSVRSTAATEELTLDYRSPGIAWQQRSAEAPVNQVLKLLDFLYQTSVEGYRQALRKLGREADAETFFLALVHVVGVLGDSDSLELLRDAVSGRPEEPFGRVESLWHELHRTALFQRVRRNLQDDPELRFFFGTLYFASDRRAVLELVARRFPRRDPEDLVAGWIASVGGASDGRLTARLFRWMAQGRGVEECLALLHQESCHQEGPRHEEPAAESVRATYRKIRGSALFRPLFAELRAA